MKETLGAAELILCFPEYCSIVSRCHPAPFSQGGPSDCEGFVQLQLSV